ncbi:hypothetical protein [Rhodopseudomonas sp.]|uniref:hypothetical protein n=1 Tax=Rhodopseudomonas sp. TaxID=1078 RepID=UPI003B3B2D93
MGSNFFRIIYYILVIACVGVSSYLSYFGFKASFGELALPFTFILGIGLFGADALLQRARESGASVLPPLLIFTCFAVFSTISNFTHIYTNFMQADVVRSALDSQYAVFRDDLVATRKRLIETPSFTQTRSARAEVERELSRLNDQATDPLRYGCGERCQVHLNRISELLGKPLADTAIPALGSDPAVVEAWLTAMQQAAMRDFDALSTTNSYPALSALVADIDTTLLAFQTPEQALAANQGLDILGKLAEESAEIQRRANALLPPPLVAHTPINRTLGRLGEVPYAIENGFIEMPNPLATFVSLILAAIVDIFPVIFALVAFSPEAGRVAKPVATRGRSAILD